MLSLYISTVRLLSQGSECGVPISVCGISVPVNKQCLG